MGLTDMRIDVKGEEKMKFNLKVAILLAIVGVGVASYYYYRESQKKPEFNVFDLKVETYVAYVYVQNMGTADAHDVGFGLSGVNNPQTIWDYDSLSMNGSRLEILRVGEIEKVTIRLDFYVGKQFTDYIVVVESAEGVHNEFHFKK